MSTKAINPNAASIRAALKSAGLEDAIRKIVTGPKVAYLYVSDSPQTVAVVTTALSPLWSDSESRITHHYGDVLTVDAKVISVATITISRDLWEDTVPASVTLAQPERRPAAVGVRTEDSERAFRTKPGTHAPGRLVARSKCRRNRRR